MFVEDKGFKHYDTFRDSQEVLDELASEGVLSQSAIKEANTYANDFFGRLRSLQDYSREQYWENYQALFGFFTQGKGRYLPMNAANLCPEPEGLMHNNSACARVCAHFN